MQGNELFFQATLQLTIWLTQSPPPGATNLSIPDECAFTLLSFSFSALVSIPVVLALVAAVLLSWSLPVAAFVLAASLVRMRHFFHWSNAASSCWCCCVEQGARAVVCAVEDFDCF